MKQKVKIEFSTEYGKETEISKELYMKLTRKGVNVNLQFTPDYSTMESFNDLLNTLDFERGSALDDLNTNEFKELCSCDCVKAFKCFYSNKNMSEYIVCFNTGEELEIRVWDE